MKEVFIVLRSDGHINGVFSTVDGASNWCMRLNGKHTFYSFSYESYEVDDSDGLSNWLDD